MESTFLTPVSFTAPVELVQQLRQRAHDTRKPQAVLIRAAIQAYLQQPVDQQNENVNEK